MFFIFLYKIVWRLRNIERYSLKIRGISSFGNYRRLSDLRNSCADFKSQIEVNNKLNSLIHNR